MGAASAIVRLVGRALACVRSRSSARRWLVGNAVGALGPAVGLGGRFDALEKTLEVVANRARGRIAPTLVAFEHARDDGGQSGRAVLQRLRRSPRDDAALDRVRVAD